MEKLVDQWEVQDCLEYWWAQVELAQGKNQEAFFNHLKKESKNSVRERNSPWCIIHPPWNTGMKETLKKVSEAPFSFFSPFLPKYIAAFFKKGNVKV